MFFSLDKGIYMYYFKIKTKIKNKGPDKMSRKKLIKKQDEIINRMDRAQTKQSKIIKTLEKMLNNEMRIDKMSKLKSALLEICNMKINTMDADSAEFLNGKAEAYYNMIMGYNLTEAEWDSYEKSLSGSEILTHNVILSTAKEAVC